jgi:hypothetical protein
MTQSESAAAATPPVTPTKLRPARIPWREIARRLAGGAQPAAIAPDYGIDEDRIWRHLRKSLRFRFYLQQAIERQRLLAGLQLAATAPGALVSRGQQAETLDGDTLRLLGEAGGSAAPAEGGVGKQIERLGETAAPPPNMAWRARMAAERRSMDLQAAEAIGFGDGLNSGLAHAARGTFSPDRPDSIPNGPDSASTGPELAPNRPESVSTGPDSPPAEPESTALPRRSRPPSPQRPLPPEPPRYRIVDLDGPDLERLRAAGLIGRGGSPDS